MGCGGPEYGIKEREWIAVWILYTYVWMLDAGLLRAEEKRACIFWKWCGQAFWEWNVLEGFLHLVLRNVDLNSRE